MSGLLNDPSIKELAEQMAEDPSFKKMAEQLQKTLNGASQDGLPVIDNRKKFQKKAAMRIPKFKTIAEKLQKTLIIKNQLGPLSQDGRLPSQDDLPDIDNQQHLFLPMEKAMQIPNFKTMAESLCNAWLQDPSVSSMLRRFTDLPDPSNKNGRMERINRDPSLKDILDEIETGGPAAMMRYWNDEEVLKKLGLVMGIIPNIGEAATSSDNPLGLGPPFSEDHEKLLFGFMLKLNLVDSAFTRFTLNTSLPFYWFGYSCPKSGKDLCVHETKMSWRKALIPLLAELEEEEKVKVDKLEEKVNVTQLEKLKIKVPRFTKEIILVLYLHHILVDMSRFRNIRYLVRRAHLSEEAYKQGGEKALAAAIMAKSNEGVAEGLEMYREKQRKKQREEQMLKLKRRHGDMDDKIPY